MATKTKTRKSKLTVKQFIKANDLKDKGIGEQIEKLGKKGKFSKEEIIAAGFNRNTVYRQYRERVG